MTHRLRGNEVDYNRQELFAINCICGRCSFKIFVLKNCQILLLLTKQLALTTRKNIHSV